MAIGHVRADDEEQVGGVEVGVGPGWSVRAERLLVAGAGAGHAQPGVRLDVLGADVALGQLVRQVLGLDGHLPGHVQGDGVRAVVVHDRAQPRTDVADRVIDRYRVGFATAAGPDEGGFQPAAAQHHLGVGGALGAQPAEVGGVQFVAGHLRDDGRSTVGPRGLHHDAAADAAVRAGGPGACPGGFSRHRSPSLRRPRP